MVTAGFGGSQERTRCFTCFTFIAWNTIKTIVFFCGLFYVFVYDKSHCMSTFKHPFKKFCKILR